MTDSTTYRVTLEPSGHQFTVDGATTLLQAALDAGFTLPHGCRDGACGSCKAQVRAGSIDHGKALAGALPEAERAAGMALLCCATARSDLAITCREVSAARDIPVRMLPCRVQSLERAASDVMVITLKLPAGERLQFLAGQYLEFMLKDGKRRAFSIANAPQGAETLELHVRLVPGGAFTGHVFATMREKDILRFQGPLGGFFWRDSTRPAILLAGGTGFAPIQALVEDALARGDARPLHVYWGARTQEGLYRDALAAGWAARHPSLRYTPVLSDAPAESPWRGRRGLAHRAVLEDHASLAGFDVYACGAPAMIEAARQDFAAAGLAADAFFADAFSFAAD